MLDVRARKRFIRYSSIGGATFLLDLLFLFFFIDIIGWQSLWAVGTAFLLAVSINFTVSRIYVFPGSERLTQFVFTNYLIIAFLGFFFVMGAMYVFVELWQWHYLISRVGVAALAGLCNYLINLHLNFRVAGKDF